MTEIVYNILEEFGIKEKFFCVITDNMNNNLLMIKELNKLLSNDDIKWDYKTQHISYLIHIINLKIQKFFKIIIKDIEDPANSVDDDDVYSDDFPSFEDVFMDNVFDPVSFEVILDKVHSIVKSIHGSSFRWKWFE